MGYNIDRIQDTCYGGNLSAVKKKVLFLCTGNSVRSQMAEALVNHYRGSQWQAFSAGTEPAGFVHPLALQALAEIGIKHQGRSKSTAEFGGHAIDLVITVCDDAAENCPVWLGQGKKAHLGFPDPAKASGSDEERLQAFRRLREDILERVLPFLDQAD